MLLTACLRVATVTSLLASSSLARAQVPDPGWATYDIASTGSYTRRYVPASAVSGAPPPVVVFLHGSGARPENWEPFVEGPAEESGCVVLLPKSLAAAGWSGADDRATIAESLRLLGREMRLDGARIAIAGHSSGGAFAYLEAYRRRSRYSAVFVLSAPYVPLAGIANPRYTAPILLHYGDQDPNFTGGGAAALVQQLRLLGVPCAIDLAPGYGHNTWPDGTIERGFRFLVDHVYPLTPEAPRTMRGWRRVGPS